MYISNPIIINCIEQSVNESVLYTSSLFYPFPYRHKTNKQ